MALGGWRVVARRRRAIARQRVAFEQQTLRHYREMIARDLLPAELDDMHRYGPPPITVEGCRDVGLQCLPATGHPEAART